MIKEDPDARGNLKEDVKHMEVDGEGGSVDDDE